MNPNFNIQPDELIEKKTIAPTDQTLEHAPRALRTFEEDIADAMRDGKGSVLTVALAEQKRKSDSVTFQTDKKNNVWLIVFGMIFFLASAAVLGYIGYTKYTEGIIISKDANTNIAVSDVISADKVTKIDLNKLLPKNGIAQSMIYLAGGTDLSTKSIQLIIPTINGANGQTTLVDNKTILQRIGSHAPAILTRSIAGNILFGTYSGDSASPFILIKSSSYEGVFSGLLEWEDFMSDDLFVFMGVTLPSTLDSAPSPINENLPTSATSSSASSTVVTEAAVAPTNTRDINKFVDRTIKNKDVRVLQDDTGRIYFIYGFADPDTVVITTSSEAFFEISSRLR